MGHDFGGTCISYAMELFPSKITKAVFIAAAMLRNGQSTLDMWSQQVGFAVYVDSIGCGSLETIING